jgi:hypothetical protein
MSVYTASDHVWIDINALTREEIAAILEDRGGYQCYDHESAGYLRGVLHADIMGKVLPRSVLEYRRAPKGWDKV